MGRERNKRTDRADLLARPVRSKSLFDVEGSIDFDVCENGEIDLR